jgi:hypothetical protein
MEPSEEEEDVKRPRRELVHIENLKTASELYLYNRALMRESGDEYEIYKYLMESISIAISMLGETFTEEITEANAILSDKDNYPQRQNINYMDSRKVYQCSLGEEETGHIVVRPEELEIAQKRLRAQQANSIIKRLKPFDNKLFALLMREGLIKKQELSDAFEKELVRNFQKELI